MSETEHFVLSPRQLRMARAALDLSTRALGARVGLSAQTISRYERGHLGVLSLQTMERLVAFLTAQGVFFGPHDGVCLQEDAFADDCWFGLACYQILLDLGMHPSSRALLDAFKRAQGDRA
jgi:transcriptional regulator with XRE-family HTH domain